MKFWYIVLTACALAGSAIAQSPPVERIVTIPGDRIENVYEAPDGALYFTAVFGNKVRRRAPNGDVQDFLNTLHNPQGVLPYRSGFVIDWQERTPNFTDPNGFSFAGLGPRLSVTDARGNEIKALSGPDETAFYNGMAFAGPDTLLIADPGGDRILRADLKAGKVSTWVSKTALVAALGDKGAPNGLKTYKGWVYFARGDIYKIKIGNNGKPSGTPILAAQTGGTDDFDIAWDGAIYATGAKGIVRAAADAKDGKTEIFLGTGADFATAVRVSRDGKSIFISGGGVPFIPGSPDGYILKASLK